MTTNNKDKISFEIGLSKIHSNNFIEENLGVQYKNTETNNKENFCKNVKNIFLIC